MKPSLYSIETCPIGSLFIMPKPSGEWLEEDIGHYKMQGITDVVSLLRSDEVAELCCILQDLGLDAVEAIRSVSDARGVTVPDTIEQREFILNYMNQ